MSLTHGVNYIFPDFHIETKLVYPPGSVWWVIFALAQHMRSSHSGLGARTKQDSMLLLISSSTQVL